MWKILLVDDEAVIVKGLRRLVNWSLLDAEIIGEATDGLSAAKIIESEAPDLVISDIRMPGMTGLELMSRYGSSGTPKFIFVSGYESFEYAREALSGGAVEYLLKPVSAQELEKAVRKALGLVADSSAAALMRNSSVPLHDFFNQLTANREFAGEELYSSFASLLGGKDDPIFMGLCFGLSHDTLQQLNALPYERRLLQTFVAFNAVRDELERSGYGCFLRKDASKCCMLGMFAPFEDPIEIVRTALKNSAEKTGYSLKVGIGRCCNTVEELSLTYEDSLRALDLYYFESDDILIWNGSPHIPTATNEDFDLAVKQVFHSIVSKSESVDCEVDCVLNIVADLHYANKTAAFNRVMVFTGDLCQQLYSNHLLTGSFTERQDALQSDLESCTTYDVLRSKLKDYYAHLLSDIYNTAGSKTAKEIYSVKEFINQHYAEEISLKTLAEIACVSPHYFSAYFKSETGQNYKAFLTQIRMENAMALVLDTDLKTYEIAEKVGYNNVRRFVDAFKNIYDLSPMDYRKLHRK